VRVRALPAPHYSIADGNPQHGYIDISIRLRAGRPLDVKKAATQAIFDAAEVFLAPVMARRPLALSLEMRDIDPDLSPKTGTIRDSLKD
jgi:5-carboxymethyl-2-hydroxymuconate isomerase